MNEKKNDDDNNYTAVYIIYPVTDIRVLHTHIYILYAFNVCTIIIIITIIVHSRTHARNVYTSMAAAAAAAAAAVDKTMESSAPLRPEGGPRNAIFILSGRYVYNIAKVTRRRRPTIRCIPPVTRLYHYPAQRSRLRRSGSIDTDCTVHFCIYPY